MEPQVDICFKKDKKRRCCMDIAIFILVIFIAFVIGLIVGTLTDLISLLGLGAVILFLVTLIILLAIEAIIFVCCRRKNC